MVKKKNKIKIQVAIALKVLVAIWNMLTKQENFIDLYLKKLEKEKNTPSKKETATTK